MSWTPREPPTERNANDDEAHRPGLKALTQPKPAPVAISDTDVKQLQVRASINGTVSFSVLKRPPGSRTLARFPVGTYPLIALAEARVKAREILREIESGVDPRVRKAEEARAASAAKDSTFAAVAEAFITRYIRNKRSAHEIEQLIRRTLIPRWGERPIGSITRGDVIGLIDEIVDRGYPEAAHTTLAYTRRLFSWAVPRYNLEHAPTDHVRAIDLIGPKAIRKRVLNEHELALIWRATEDARGNLERVRPRQWGVDCSGQPHEGGRGACHSAAAAGSGDPAYAAAERSASASQRARVRNDQLQPSQEGARRPHQDAQRRQGHSAVDLARLPAHVPHRALRAQDSAACRRALHRPYPEGVGQDLRPAPL